MDKPLPSRTSDTAAGPVPKILDAVGMLAAAGGGLGAVLLLVEAPFDGPWAVIAAVAAVFAGIYAGFLMMGFAATLRLPGPIRRRLDQPTEPE
ncbi:hypothetical protein [Azospirillum halopraeferens]|uniref:hypothetical protein n=1 Tax=Azospirillum halopraeferens TaxID=34010 RepID=UPI00048EF7F8|nr:hypothetical protein [Azospirillum halopraeferens]